MDTEEVLTSNKLSIIYIYYCVLGEKSGQWLKHKESIIRVLVLVMGSHQVHIVWLTGRHWGGNMRLIMH